jgi:hypothetical protein
MFSNTLVKTVELQIGTETYSVKYFENRTLRGTLRYSSELLLGPDDRIILDGNSLTALESKVARLVPATIYSRMLAARAA